mgnify:CR=1 FL=1
MIESQHGRRVFAFQVAGLEHRYHSINPPSSSSLSATIATGISYVDHQGIVSVSDFSATIDPSGGVAEYDAVTLSLSIDKRRGVSGDPGIIFGRCGARSAGTRVQLAASLERDGTLIRTSSSLTSLSYPRLLHVGGETFRASAANAISVNVSGGRGAGGTPIQSHSISLEGSAVPEVTTEITTFRGRLAKLFMAHQYPSGEVSDYVELISGFISESPYIEEGDSVSISLLPLTALLETSLADKGIGQTGLLQDYHYYDGFSGSLLEYALALRPSPDSSDSYIRVTPDTGSAITASTFNVVVSARAGGANLLDDFDPALAAGQDADDFISEHPRFPKFRRHEDFPTSDEGVFTSGLTYNGAIPGYVVNANSTPNNALSSGQISATSSLKLKLGKVELKQHSLGSAEVKAWPDVINDTLTANGPSSSGGYAGGVAKWRVTTANEVRGEKLSSSPFPVYVYFWGSRDVLSVIRSWRETQAVETPRLWSAAGTSTGAPDTSRLVYPLSFDQRSPGASGFSPILQRFGEGSPYVYGRVEVSGSDKVGLLALRPLPRAYYQHYETVILVEGSLGLPSSAGSDRFDITVKFVDQDTQETREQTFICTHETSASFGGSNIGTLIHIASEHDHSQTMGFGDWPDGDRVNIFRGGRLTRERPGVALLKILESGGGAGINGTYDVLGIGLNLSSSLIDEASFLAVDSAGSLPMTGSLFGSGQDLMSSITSILKMLGAVITMQRDKTTGLSKITLVPVGFEKSSNSAETIAAGDWLADPPPRWGIYDDIVTQVEFNYDYDPADDQLKSKLLFNDQEAISRYGGERSKIKIDLPGVSSRIFGAGAGNAFSFFLPTASRLFNLLANPLRSWSGSIGTGQSAYLDVGSYVKVSSPHLRGYSDNYGVTDGIGMIRTITQSLQGEGCDLEIITTGLSPVNWNSSARVSSISSTTAVVIDGTAFSSSGDAAFFKAGDVVQHLPKGNHDGAGSQLTIQTVSGNTITFTGVHSISSTGGTIEPATYSAVSATHREDAFLANNSDKINVTVDAQEFN